MQDLTAALISLLDNLVVTFNAVNYTIRANYATSEDTLYPPCISVDVLTVPADVGGIGNDARMYHGQYRVNVHVLETDAYTGEAFRTSLADAVQKKVDGSPTLGSAWGVRVVGYQPLPPVQIGQAWLFEGSLTVRAESVELL